MQNKEAMNRREEMKRRNRDRKKEEKVDDSWLLPYSDMLTLLLALFIVLFAMSEIDVKKFENLASIFKTEFTSGSGMIDEGVSIIPEQSPVDASEEEKEDEDKEEKEKSQEETINNLQSKEYEELQSIQRSLEEYIARNSLTETLGT